MSPPPQKSMRDATTSLLATLLLISSLPSHTKCLSIPSKSPKPSSFANGILGILSPIAFGTLNPTYDETPAGLAELLDSLPKGTLIDTAEKYGANDGDAETALGKAIQLSGRTFQYNDQDEDTNDTNDNQLMLEYAIMDQRMFVQHMNTSHRGMCH